MMVDKDFAQVETSQFDSEDMRPATSNQGLWLSVVAIAFSMLCFGIGFYMGEKSGVEVSRGQGEHQFIATIKAQQEELKTLKEEAQQRQLEVSTSKVGELTFYHELPQQSIIPEPLDGPAKPKVATATSAISTLKVDINLEQESIAQVEQKIEDIIQAKLNNSARSFRIQIASFKLHKDALAFQPKLKDIGIESTIHRVDLPNIGIWYRVYSTSFSKEQQAMHAKLAIKDKLKVTGILIQDE
ncbi:MAG: SPOR domain-containing protein [Mariprofundaceae bacterium]|nr:SPOR domain-containing protein [Mariprofundaceae bacterium]